MASKVTGFKETAARIRHLANGVVPSVRAASVKALAPIKDSAKANLRANGSVKRGVLLKSIVVKPVKSDRSRMTHQVYASGKGNSIAHLVEFGTEPHYQPNRGIMHPGAEPKPFLTPAYNENDDQAVRVFGKEVAVQLARRIK